ncbi:hypothetical protein HF290_14915 [Acidithiobacillus ferrooxidans]|uniref:hypothetical protein n=1 Tax=Acidithiobacillus ferrooxidans TaxID=920 RepID=UPI001C07D3ED|nr:hypothetical protein [Acidithiobacillus ferrooxidans]MBU2861628.1 hypothetical protein [Acidithiobacillus ferrooxidans]
MVLLMVSAGQLQITTGKITRKVSFIRGCCFSHGRCNVAVMASPSNDVAHYWCITIDLMSMLVHLLLPNVVIFWETVID